MEEVQREVPSVVPGVEQVGTEDDIWPGGSGLVEFKAEPKKPARPVVPVKPDARASEAATRAVHLLLTDKPTVARWLEAGPDAEAFASCDPDSPEGTQQVLRAVREQWGDGSLLTRASLKARLAGWGVIPKATAGALSRYDACRNGVAGVSPDDWAMLSREVSESAEKRRFLWEFQRYSEELKSNPVGAPGRLLQRLNASASHAGGSAEHGRCELVKMSDVMGSVAFKNLSRTAFIVTKDPRDPERRLMLPVKSNVGREAPGLAFRIDGVSLGTDGDGRTIEASRVAWEEGTVDMSADEAVAEPGETPTRVGEAVDWLRGLLQMGPQSSEAVERQARERGVSPATLKRARGELGVEAVRAGGLGGSGRWMLTLPGAGGDQPATGEDGGWAGL